MSSADELKSPAQARFAGSVAKSARELKLQAASALVEKAHAWMRSLPKPSPTVKFSYASRLYRTASDTFRSIGAWRRAAEALRSAAGAERQRFSMIECATLHAEAGEFFSRVDGGEAMVSLTTAAGLFAAAGRLLTAANLTLRVGELEEADEARASASKSFSTAADYFLALDHLPQAVSALWHAGGNLAHEQDFEGAHATFERASRIAFDDNLVRFNTPKLQLNAALCLAADWSAKRTTSEKAARKLRGVQSGELASASLSRRELTTIANNAERTAAVANEAFSRIEVYIRKAAARDSWFSTGREKRFLYDLIDAARLWSTPDVIDHIWNFDYVAGFAPHELAMCEYVYRSIESGPPADLLKARRETADHGKVVEMEEEYAEEVEIMKPMTAEELRKSGIAEELEAEAAADKAEEEADKLAEELLKNPRAVKQREREKLALEAKKRASMN